MTRARAWWDELGRSERLALAGAAVTATALVVAYAALRHPNPLAGDQREYHQMAVLFTEGKPWHGFAPFGNLHASAYRPPVYPAWTGLWYALLGPSPTRVALVQAPLAGLTVVLTFALARRLLGRRAALAVAWVTALNPFVWEWFGLLYTEALAIPLVTGTLLLVLDRPPTTRLAVGVGALLGAGLLLRPTSFFVVAAVLVAFFLATGWRRAASLGAVAVGAALLVVAPWSIRNYVVTDAFIPLSAQDGALLGTFNETSANDPDFPYAWRPNTPENIAMLAGPVLDDAEYRRRQMQLGLDYVEEHPSAVAGAFWWNGVVRFWDLRPIEDSLVEVPFEGRAEVVTRAGLSVHRLLLPLAIAGVVRHRRRRPLVLPVAALALGASIVFTLAAGTRYRAPLEPLLGLLAVMAFVAPVGASGGAAPDAEAAPAPAPG